MKQKKFVGFDVHKDTIAIVVVDEQGDSLIQSVVATDGDTICDFLKGLGGEIHVALEVGTQSNWLFRQIKPLVEKVVVCDPRHNKLLVLGNKADLIDAEKLAQLLRLGALREVFQHSAEQAFLKELVRTHENLISDSVKVKNRIKAIYRAQAMECSGSSVYQSSNRDHWLTKLTEPGMKFRALLLFQELDTLTGLRTQATRAMLREARKHEDFHRLCKIPGLGLINVSRLLAQVGTPNRFQTKRQFWKYCGLAVTTRSSADHQFIDGKLRKRIKQTQTRGLNRQFCHRLKYVFKTAARKAAGREPFQPYYENLLKSGTRPSLAQVSLARKIAATALSIWKNQTDFETRAVCGRSHPTS